MQRVEAVNGKLDTAKYESTKLPAMDPLDVLESLVGKDPERYFWVYGSDNETIVALDPIGEIVVAGDQIDSTWSGEPLAHETASDPFAQVGRLLNEMPVENWRAFGHISFDAAGYYLPYPLQASTPPMRFIIPRTELIFTKETTDIRTLGNPDQMLRSLDDIKQFSHSEPNVPTPDTRDRKAYERDVAELVKDIHAGHLAKAILARYVHLPGSIDIFSTYNSIRKANSAARTYCFSQKDLSGVGSSPELLMQTTPEGAILTTPLAGTRPRGETPERDVALRYELQTDPKEIKEHILSVLLVQQEELQSVCEPDSVCIKGLMQVLQFRTVQHLSSRVHGQLKSGLTLWDGLRALFPGVTVSGVDKATAVKRIAELEKTPRGPYAGCVGWVDSKGASDFAIALRSAFEDSSGVSMSAGAGIIAESLPTREYDETVHKMRTIQSQLVLSESL